MTGLTSIALPIKKPWIGSPSLRMLSARSVRDPSGDAVAKPTKPPPAAASPRAAWRGAANANGFARLRVELPSSRRAITDAVRKIMRVATEMRCSKSHRADLEIALREALANAVIHGNRGDPKKKVIVRCTFSRSRGTRLAVRDEGKGFNPRGVPDPREPNRRLLHHGRGLFLMRALMDRLEHRDGGREVVLVKERGRKG